MLITAYWLYVSYTLAFSLALVILLCVGVLIATGVAAVWDWFDNRKHGRSNRATIRFRL